MAGAEPDATGLVPPAATGVRRVLLLGVWLGLVHLNVGVLVVLFLALRPLYATLALAAWIATGLLPVAETRAADGGWFAAEIVRTAEAYHKMRVVFDDKAALEAAASKAPVVFAYAPHAVLPNCVAAFAYDGPVRRALHHLPTIKDMRVLASSCFMWLPVLHHVWTWMGGAPVSRKKIREHLSAGRSVVLTPGGVAETLLLDRQDEVLFLKKRFGFVRLAAEQGAYIVPVFAFGQRDVYSWYIPFQHTKILHAVSHFLHVVPCVYWGLLGTPIPVPKSVTIVVGTPIPTSDVGRATGASRYPDRGDVRRKLAEVVAGMEALYQKYAAACGQGHVALRIC